MPCYANRAHRYLPAGRLAHAPASGLAGSHLFHGLASTVRPRAIALHPCFPALSSLIHSASLVGMEKPMAPTTGRSSSGDSVLLPNDRSPEHQALRVMERALASSMRCHQTHCRSKRLKLMFSQSRPGRADADQFAQESRFFAQELRGSRLPCALRTTAPVHATRLWRDIHPASDIE